MLAPLAHWAPRGACWHDTFALAETMAANVVRHCQATPGVEVRCFHDFLEFAEAVGAIGRRVQLVHCAARRAQSTKAAPILSTSVEAV